MKFNSKKETKEGNCVIRTIFFDVDDTMYDEVHPKIKGELQVVEYVSEVLGRPFQEVYDTFIRSKKEVIDYSALDPNRNNRTKWYERMLQYLKTDTIDPEKLSERYWDIILNNIEPYYDFKCILPTLVERYDLYVLTDELLEIQQKKLTKLGLIDKFKGIISSTHVGVVKPNPELFEYAMKVAGSTAATSLMIGDKPTRDIRGGKSVNMATGWIRRGKFYNVDLGEDVPDIVIKNYMKLPEQIEKYIQKRGKTMPNERTL
jgi:FMN phosphatase YigB (HAD superfamily)